MHPPDSPLAAVYNPALIRANREYARMLAVSQERHARRAADAGVKLSAAQAKRDRKAAKRAGHAA
jgi:hypothetical protein